MPRSHFGRPSQRASACRLDFLLPANVTKDPQPPVPEDLRAAILRQHAAPGDATWARSERTRPAAIYWDRQVIRSGSRSDCGMRLRAFLTFETPSQNTGRSVSWNFATLHQSLISHLAL